jgi:polysaccharide export outer membrane protein
MGNYKFVIAVALLALSILAISAGAQQAEQPVSVPRSAYLLGPDDVIAIKAVDAEEISDKSIRIGPNGSINLPMVGRVQAGGLTAEELEKELVVRLKPFIRKPEVSVNVVELRSQPVSLIGAVASPGVHQLQGRKTLVEMLSLAGGVRPDAGYSVKITRKKHWGPIPLPGAAQDPSGEFSVAEVNLKQIMEARNPAENIYIMPNDVISVPRAEMIYVIGDVKKAGGFVLSDASKMSVLQALSMASGLEKTAKGSGAKILRVSASKDMKRSEIPVNLKNILDGKDEDVSMEREDILFVPGNKTKAAALKVIESALQIGTGIAIYRTY